MKHGGALEAQSIKRSIGGLSPNQLQTSKPASLYDNLHLYRSTSQAFIPLCP